MFVRVQNLFLALVSAAIVKSMRHEIRSAGSVRVSGQTHRIENKSVESVGESRPRGHPDDYAMFREGSEWRSLRAKIECPGEAPLTPKLIYSLFLFSDKGASGVLYRSYIHQDWLVKFARGKNKIDFLQDEIRIATLVPSWVPKAILCTAVVVSKGTSSSAPELPAGTHTFPVLVKQKVTGVEMGDVLMMLASPKTTKGALFASSPATCKLDAGASSKKFNKERYLEAYNLQKGKKKRTTLAGNVRNSIKCLLGTLEQLCGQSTNSKDRLGFVISDVKPENLMYGSVGQERENRLFLIDATIHKVHYNHLRLCSRMMLSLCDREGATGDFSPETLRNGDCSNKEMGLRDENNSGHSDEWPNWVDHGPCFGTYWEILPATNFSCG